MVVFNNVMQAFVIVRSDHNDAEQWLGIGTL